MSYILDALRKSDRQRHSDLVSPPQAAVRTTTLHVGGWPGWLLFGLPALALLALGVVIGAWRPWSVPPPAAAVPAVAAAPTVALPQVGAATKPAKAKAAPAPAAAEKTAAGDMPATAPQKTESAPPPATKKELPEIAITVHAYAENPADRAVRINGQLLHEGDAVAPGLKLEQIVADGVVLNYKGQRIRRGL